MLPSFAAHFEPLGGKPLRAGAVAPAEHNAAFVRVPVLLLSICSQIGVSGDTADTDPSTSQRHPQKTVVFSKCVLTCSIYAFPDFLSYLLFRARPGIGPVRSHSVKNTPTGQMFGAGVSLPHWRGPERNETCYAERGGGRAKRDQERSWRGSAASRCGAAKPDGVSRRAAMMSAGRAKKESPATDDAWTESVSGPGKAERNGL